MRSLTTWLTASLLVALLAARTAILWGERLPDSAWALSAFVWQDIAVALAFLTFAYLVGRIARRFQPAIVLSVYAALVVLVAASIPAGVALSKPLAVLLVVALAFGPPLLATRRGRRSAARGPDLPQHEPVRGGTILIPARAHQYGAGGFSRRARTRRRVSNTAAIVVLLAVAGTGIIAARFVDTQGLEHNAVVAFVGSSMPRVRAAFDRAGSVAATGTEWRASPRRADDGEGAATPVDLGHLRGAAAGANVLLVVLESTGARYLGAYGAAGDPTPNLTDLAGRAIVFDNAYAVYPESVKGLVSLLASRDPAFDVDAPAHARLMTPSLATALGDAGYDTGLFHSGRFPYLGMRDLLDRSGFATLEDAGHISGDPDSSFGVDEASAVRRLLAWIDERPAGRPFFVAYLPIAGSHPYAYTTPGPFPSYDDFGRYRNALHEGDSALGRLIDGLRERGLAESTLVVVTANHGEAFGQHDGNVRHNLAIYDENVRVPLIIAMPSVAPARAYAGAVDAGSRPAAIADPTGATGNAPATGSIRVERVASLIDVGPTILDMLGLTEPATFDGASLLDPEHRVALFFTDQSPGLLGLRDRCFKLIHAIDAGTSQLYDVCNDPDERRNLGSSPEYDHRVEKYAERLRAWSAARVREVGGGGG